MLSRCDRIDLVARAAETIEGLGMRIQFDVEIDDRKKSLDLGIDPGHVSL
jgi:hypothetical protein